MEARGTIEREPITTEQALWYIVENNPEQQKEVFAPQAFPVGLLV